VIDAFAPYAPGLAVPQARGAGLRLSPPCALPTPFATIHPAGSSSLRVPRNFPRQCATLKIVMEPATPGGCPKDI
jgi:hypothetical protein